jgi:hypothetical protein
MTRLSLIAILFIASLSGCKKEDDDTCLSFRNDEVLDAQGATTGGINQDIPFTVTYALSNGCGSFAGFEQQTSGNTISVYAKTKYEGCICTQDYRTFQSVYNFRATQAGTYTLQFLKPDSTFLTRIVSIQ